MEDQAIQAVLERHWSNLADQEGLHGFYHEEVVVEFPQSGERIAGLTNLRALRETYAAAVTFTVNRVHSDGNHWITEGVLTYEGRTMRTVTIMEIRDGKVARETTYFGEGSEPPSWRAHWVETD